jgi:hypothetical protein
MQPNQAVPPVMRAKGKFTITLSESEDAVLIHAATHR